MCRPFFQKLRLAGPRSGYVIALPEIAARLRGQLRNFHLNRLRWPPALPPQDKEYVQESARLAEEGKAYLYGVLERLEVQTWPSEGNFLLVRSPAPAAEVYQKLLERGVMVRQTDMFGYPEGLRVTVGSAEANQAFIQALEEIVT
ncbi:MAG: aminotransferase class I/II-fold pyridoxal phosphate-dependent enzyme [Caldilineaceae bacterium]